MARSAARNRNTPAHSGFSAPQAAYWRRCSRLRAAHDCRARWRSVGRSWRSSAHWSPTSRLWHRGQTTVPAGTRSPQPAQRRECQLGSRASPAAVARARARKARPAAASTATGSHQATTIPTTPTRIGPTTRTGQRRSRSAVFITGGLLGPRGPPGAGPTRATRPTTPNERRPVLGSGVLDASPRRLGQSPQGRTRGLRRLKRGPPVPRACPTRSGWPRLTFRRLALAARPRRALGRADPSSATRGPCPVPPTWS